MFAAEYLAAARLHHATRPPGAPWVEELMVESARRFAALDRALGPTPTIEDLRELRLWRRGIEMFGPVACNVYRPRPRLAAV